MPVEGDWRVAAGTVISFFSVEHPVMVIAVAVADLFEIGLVDSFADDAQRCEVHRGSGHGQDFTCCHIGGVDRCISGGVHVEFVVCNGLQGIAVEVEVGVVCHVDDRRFIGHGLVGDVETVVGCQSVGDFGSDVSGEVVVTVGRVHGEDYCRVVGLFGIIDLILPSSRTAVQAVAEIIGRKLDCVTVDYETALIDAVGIAADGCAEVSLVVFGKVGCDAVESENDIARLAVAVGYHQRYLCGRRSL